MATASPLDITYPPIAEPEAGSGLASEIAPGVLWMRMPLAGSLAAINVWALADGETWTIVDTGLANADTIEAWEVAAQCTLAGRRVDRVAVTHFHGDHSGMVGWLHARFGTALWITRLEYMTLRLGAAETPGAPPAATLDFYRRAGLDSGWIEAYRQRFGHMQAVMTPPPAQFRALADGDSLRTGDIEWRVVVGKGHSPEHACLWAPEARLLISGDQVLPRISSNVSVYAIEPAADPLSDWLRTLARIRDIVPDDVLVLPGHGRPFRGLHARIGALIRGHEEGLERLQAMLGEPRRAVDVFPALFRRTPEDGMVRGMATGEALAHLVCLQTRGVAAATPDPDGVTWWRRAAAAGR